LKPARPVFFLQSKHRITVVFLMGEDFGLDGVAVEEESSTKASAALLPDNAFVSFSLLATSSLTRRPLFSLAMSKEFCGRRISFSFLLSDMFIFVVVVGSC